MTPAETEHFAALRMHVARLHVALKEAAELAETDASGRFDLDRMKSTLAISEPDVRELLAEADRDNALVQARADRDAAIDATMQIGKRCTTIEGACRHLVAVYRGEDAGSEAWAGELTAAVEQLAGVVST